MVKKITLLILGIAMLSAICVISFFVVENNKAVVSWLNGQTLVTNDDYAELVDSTNKTISELNGQISELENANISLNSELNNVTNLYNQELGKAEANEKLLQEYMTEINNIKTQLDANVEMLDYLTALINEMCGQMLDSIIELPDEFQAENVSINYTLVDNNDFFIVPTASNLTNRGLYFFDYSKGSLTKIDSLFQQVPYNFHSINNGYIYRVNTDLYVFDLSSMTVTLLYESAGNRVQYFETSDGFYILTHNYTLYYSYIVDDFTILNSTAGAGSSSNISLFEFGNDLFYISGTNLHYINKLTNDYSLLSSSVTSSCTIFNVGDEYIVFSSGYCYKIDLASFKLETIASDLSFSSVSGVVSNDMLVVFLGSKGLYTYSATTGLLSCFNCTSSNITISILYVGDNYFLITLSSISLPGIYKVNNDGSIEQLYDKAYNWLYSYSYDETLLVSSDVSRSGSDYYDLLSIDLTSFDVTEFYQGSDGTYSIFIDLGDEIFISSTESGDFLRLDKSTNEVDYYNYTGSGSLRIVKLYDAKLYKSNSLYYIFLGSNGVAVYDRVNDSMYQFSVNYDMSDIESGVFYSHFEALENGDLYYRYEIQNDLTIEKSLAVFK